MNVESKKADSRGCRDIVHRSRVGEKGGGTSTLEGSNKYSQSTKTKGKWESCL